jgi:hypothetical protein
MFWHIDKESAYSLTWKSKVKAGFSFQLEHACLPPLPFLTFTRPQAHAGQEDSQIGTLMITLGY